MKLSTLAFPRPMDLQTIKRNIESGVIRNTAEFQRDMMLMFLNAKMYNTSDHNVYHMAHQMMKDTVSTIEVCIIVIKKYKKNKKI